MIGETSRLHSSTSKAILICFGEGVFVSAIQTQWAGDRWRQTRCLV